MAKLLVYSAHLLVLIKSIFSINPNVLNSPSCSPSNLAQNRAVWNRCPFGLDSNAWYGLTNGVYDFVDAARECESYGIVKKIGFFCEF